MFKTIFGYIKKNELNKIKLEIKDYLGDDKYIKNLDLFKHDFYLSDALNNFFGKNVEFRFAISNTKQNVIKIFESGKYKKIEGVLGKKIKYLTDDGWEESNVIKIGNETINDLINRNEGKVLMIQIKLI